MPDDFRLPVGASRHFSSRFCWPAVNGARVFSSFADRCIPRSLEPPAEGSRTPALAVPGHPEIESESERKGYAGGGLASQMICKYFRSDSRLHRPICPPPREREMLCFPRPWTVRLSNAALSEVLPRTSPVTTLSRRSQTYLYPRLFPEASEKFSKRLRIRA